jgi:hypothetical protein
VKKNPLAWNLQENCYNYLVWFRNLQCLFSEGLGKFDEREIKELEQLSLFIEEALKIMPPHISIINQMKNENTTRIKQKNWEFVKTLILKYEKYLMFALDVHGLTNPNNEDGSLF